MSINSRSTKPINEVDFSKPHDPDDYFHYMFRNDHNKAWTYESLEKSTGSIVYRGSMSYYERKDPVGYRMKMLRKRPNYRHLIQKEAMENDFLEDYDLVDAEDILQKKMREMLTRSLENENTESNETETVTET